MPKVSVLLTVYNGEKYLGAAIDSILNQTFSDFEFIIVNDGSTDNSAEIVKSYTDNRIKFIDNKQNSGLISVLNMGLDACSGEYIARMDADDVALPERFAKQVAYLDANPDVGVLGTSFCIFGENRADHIVIKKQNMTFIDVLHFCPVAHPSVMMRRSVLEKYGLRYREEYKHAEDYDLWSRMVCVTKIANLPDVLLRYRTHDSNVSVVYGGTQSATTQKIKQNMMGFLTDVPEIAKHIRHATKISRFYDTANLSKKMRKNHPIRWWKLKKKLKESIQ